VVPGELSIEELTEYIDSIEKIEVGKQELTVVAYFPYNFK
jgi:hypothetical protein